MITRRPLKTAHGKLRPFIQDNFLDYGAIVEAFVDVDACLFCLGTSVTQVSGEEEYRRITYDFALVAAGALKLHSPAAPFHFISGQAHARTAA